MSNIESIGCWILKTKKVVLVACGTAIIVVIFLATVVYFYRPIGVDGGWYSYPALALSRGGDPGENQLNVEELQDIEGVTAAFGFDTRQSIRVIPMSWWFRIFGTNIWSAKFFGILELTILMSIAYITFRRICQDKHIALLCWAIYLMDAVTIGLGAGDLRPDIMATIMVLLVFLLIRMEAKEYRILVFIAGILSMFCLALVHVTSAVPIAFLIFYMISELFVSRENLSKTRKIFYASLIITGSITFMLRKIIFDKLIHTKHEIKFAQNVESEVYKTLTSGIFPIVEKEFNRWTDYFLLGNLGELLAVLLALFLFTIYLFSSSSKKSTRICMPVGCLFAVGVLAFADSHRWGSHALPVVPFFLLILARELELLHVPKIKHLGIALLFALVFLSATIKVAQGTRIIIKAVQNGYSNAAVVDTMNNVFSSKSKSYVIICPTELWPYINPKMNVVIYDHARKGIKDNAALFLATIDFIILNDDYHDDWEREFRKRYPVIELKAISEVGNAKSGSSFVKIIKPQL